MAMVTVTQQRRSLKAWTVAHNFTNPLNMGNMSGFQKLQPDAKSGFAVSMVTKTVQKFPLHLSLVAGQVK